jgi:hypothetical protein
LILRELALLAGKKEGGVGREVISLVGGNEFGGQEGVKRVVKVGCGD